MRAERRVLLRLAQRSNAELHARLLITVYSESLTLTQADLELCCS